MQTLGYLRLKKEFSFVDLPNSQGHSLKWLVVNTSQSVFFLIKSNGAHNWLSGYHLGWRRGYEE